MIAGAHRLAQGGRIDRDRPLAFRFNGRGYQGCAGDTLASALLANGVHLVGRSFKYHRPRGILTAGAEEPNAIVQLEAGARTQPNLRATQVELYDGLEARSVNCWPGVGLDVGAVNDLLAPLLPAGFYYKTFMWPPGLWKTYERFIRRAAGLGRAPDAPDPDRYDKMHLHCDVLVVGGGPAGLAAALAAGRAGARVLLADEQSEPGGRLLDSREAISGAPAQDWVQAALAELEGLPEVRLLRRCTVAAYFDHNYLVAVERVGDHLGPAAPPGQPRQRLWKLRARQVMLATGAHERPLVFRHNDRPGVMLASAAQAYANRYAVRPGARACVFTNNDSAYGAALDLAEAGVEIAAIVDVRPAADGAAVKRATKQGLAIMAGHAVVEALGRRHVRGAAVRPLDAAGAGYAGPRATLDCDFLCLSGGWSPAVHLFSQSRGRLVYDAENACFVPGDSVQAERSAGAARGAFALADCLAQGFEAGAAAAKQAGRRGGAKGRRPRPRAEARAPLLPFWRVPAEDAGDQGQKQFVDLQNDVTAADIALSAREGYRSVEHLKRYTTLGMGTDQGKTANVPALGILAGLLETDIAGLGTTTFRPPYTPVTYGVLAGRDTGPLADPVRRTPIQQWHEQHGALFEDVGQWKRPFYYPQPGEDKQQAVDRECLAVRNAVGIMDATTLGKIDIQGPDAVTLLDRVYTNDWGKLGVGRCRYGLMLGEDGMVMDDGVTSRLGERHFLMTTTTGNAARVLAWLEEWLQTEWPELQVYCTSVTEEWATATVCGPRARELLAELAEDVDLRAQALPFMHCAEGSIAGLPARVFRVSFTGELSFEVNVRAGDGLALWTALMTAGEKYGVTPFGTEAMHVLRAEKGYIMVGQETDGTVTPLDLGMDWVLSRRKDFLGKRSLARPDLQREDRKQLVGLVTESPDTVLPEGGQIVAELKAGPPMKMIGRVTSSYFSAALGHSIALALLEGGRKRLGEIVDLPLLDGRSVKAVVCAPRFYDVQGTRLHG